jgi:hypothetical protein
MLPQRGKTIPEGGTHKNFSMYLDKILAVQVKKVSKTVRIKTGFFFQVQCGNLARNLVYMSLYSLTTTFRTCQEI